MSQDDQTLAEERTNWAEDRTLLANERTFAGWLRTGMACIGLALGLKAVFGDTDPLWLAHGVATLFLLVAIGIFLGARDNAIKAHKRFNQHETQAQSIRTTTLIAVTMSVATGAIGIILWTV